MFKEDSEVRLERPDRPPGVSILTIWDGMMFGIFPLISTVLGLVRGNIGEVTDFSIYIAAVLSVLMISTSIGAYAGNDRARLALIYVVTILQGFQAFNGFVIISSRGQPPEQIFFALIRVILALFWVLLHIWYFFRPHTLEFYRRPKLSTPSNRR